jgi:hypothetical protein
MAGVRMLAAEVARDFGLGPHELVDDSPAADADEASLRAQVARLTDSIGDETAALDGGVSLAAVLATVPTTRSWCAGRGVPPDVVAATLAGIPDNLRTFGYSFTGPDWFARIVTARVFTLGRLQFETGESVPGTGAPAWGVHIPELGPLDAAACDESFARVAPFFATVTGDTETRSLVCRSWLLDDQLRRYLPDTSNILRFQRRFTPADDEHTDAPVDGVTHGDEAVAKFVFRREVAELGSASAASTLERAVLSHLATGGHWRERAGVLPVPG